MAPKVSNHKDSLNGFCRDGWSAFQSVSVHKWYQSFVYVHYLDAKAMPYSGLSTLQVPEYGHEDLLAKAYTFQASSAASRYSILSY